MFNFGVTTPAATFDYLLVSQNGLVIRAPVHGRGFLVDQTFFVQFGEEPLLPTIVFWLAGSDFTLPVIAKAQHFQLVFHVFDVVVSPRCWRGLVFDRRVFCWQTERIPTDRLQYVFALHALVAGDHITDGVVTHVTHVQAAGRIREHGEAIKLLFAGIFGNLKRFFGIPMLLNLAFKVFRAVLLLHADNPEFCGVS